MERKEYLKKAYTSLRSWRREKEHNQHNMAHMAERAIRILINQIYLAKKNLHGDDWLEILLKKDKQ